MLLILCAIAKELNETTTPHVVAGRFRVCLDLVGIVVNVLHGHTEKQAVPDAVGKPRTWPQC